MKRILIRIKQMSTLERWKLLLTALASLLAPIAIPPLVVLGLTISSVMGLMSAWCLMGVGTLLTLTIAVNYTDLAKRIRMWKRFFSGGKQIYTGLFKN